MKLAIMQPYFFPYIGYWQLMNYSDKFIIHDIIQYTKKSWINRNRILVNGRGDYITLSLRKDSHLLDIRERYLIEDFSILKRDILNKVIGVYSKAPNFDKTYPIFKKCIEFKDRNLFNFVLHSIEIIKEYLGITSTIVTSSNVPIDHTLRGQDKIIALCKKQKANIYVNPIGGIELYKKEIFQKNGIQLKFMKSSIDEYEQFGNVFVPLLSILDVMMFNNKTEISKMLNNFELV